VKPVFTNLVLWYLRFLSSFALRNNKPSVIIGIAGSVGKSSTREILDILLGSNYTTKSIGNSETGIPLGILGIKPEGFSMLDWISMLFRAPFGVFHLKNVEILIVEMGIDDPLPPKNMAYLLSIVKPHIGIIVNESAAHTMQFEKILTQKEREQPDKERVNTLIHRITQEDLKMTQNDDCKVVIVNADNDVIISELEKSGLGTSKTLISFGSKNEHDLNTKSYEVDLKGTEMKFTFENKIYGFSTGVLLPRVYQDVLGAAMLGAIMTSRLFYNKVVDPQQLLNTLSKKFVLPKGRGSVFAGIENSLLIDSTYNASKASVVAYLDLLSEIKKKTQKNTIGILGDMRELGKEAEIEHKEVADKISTVCDEVYLVGELTKAHILPRIEKKVRIVKWFDSNIHLGEYLKANLTPESLVLLKGSQNTIFLEETVKFLLKDNNDFRNLCRQDKYWIAVKAEQNRLFHH